MNLSTKSRYGLRILVEIGVAMKSGRTSVKGHEIAAKQKISEAYMEQLMIQLKSTGFVRTIRGRNGGYQLAENWEDITVLGVIELFEGKITLVECVDGDDTANNCVCERKGICPTMPVWQRLTKVFCEEADSIKLIELVESCCMNGNQPDDYVI